MSQPFSTPNSATVDDLRAQLAGIDPADLPTSTLYALATLADGRDATVAALPADLDTTGVQTVWLVTADDFAAGSGDLDNRVWTVGVYASLSVAVAAVWRAIVAGHRVYNPNFDQQIVQTVTHPAPVICDAGSLFDVPRGWHSVDDHGAEDSGIDDPIDCTDGAGYDATERDTLRDEFGPF